MDSRVLALFDFTGRTPCVGTFSSIIQPILEDDPTQQLDQVCSFIANKTPVIVRWPKRHQSSRNLQQYSKEQPSDTDFVSGTVIMMSDDKDALTKVRDNLLKERRIPKPVTPTNQSENPTQTGVSHTARRSLSAEFSTESDAGQANQVAPVANRSRPFDLIEQENIQLKAKVQKLEGELDTLKSDYTDRAGEKVNLKDQIDELKASQPMELVKELNDAIADLKKMPTGPGQTDHLLLTPSSSRAGTPPSTPAQRMVPLDPANFPTILIEYNALRDACSYGRDSDSPESLNSMIGTIIDFFIRPSEQFKYSLTGRACRSIPNSKPKIPFPSDVLSAMTNFTMNRWDIWHKKKTTKKLIKAAVTARLVGSHTNHLNKKKKMDSLNDTAKRPSLEEDLLLPPVINEQDDDLPPPPNNNIIERVISPSSAD